jgi:tetratricopeptide (TPR) repeat protein
MTVPTSYEKVCFVIMPFNKKKVGKKVVDFDFVYENIFEPAISEAVLPEGGTLSPKRTDVDKFSSSISQDMFEYIMYSRIAFTDISGFNPNVFYELGIRHGAQESGTVIFRQPGIAIPFDINSIKVFDYELDTKEKVSASKTLISEVLTESLKRNRLDSPVRIALRAQQQPSAPGGASPAVPQPAEIPDARARQQALLDPLLCEAEETLRTGDLTIARALYRVAIRIDPSNIVTRMRLGLILKSLKRHFEALEQFSFITQLAPDYAEAWREKGLVESLINRLIPENLRPAWLPTGEDALRQATAINPQDFDAWSIWGGMLRRRQDFVGACEKYERAAQVSNNHPYPLLNALKLEAMTTGNIDVAHRKAQLQAAEELRRSQSLTVPPTDTPWCFYDLAEMKLYQGDRDGFLGYLDQALGCSEEWQIETFRRTLQETLVDNKINLSGLEEGMAKIRQAMPPGKSKKRADRKAAGNS